MTKTRKKKNSILTVIVVLITTIVLLVSLQTPIFNKKLDNTVRTEMSNKIKSDSHFVDKNIKMVSNFVKSGLSKRQEFLMKLEEKANEKKQATKNVNTKTVNKDNKKEKKVNQNNKTVTKKTTTKKTLTRVAYKDGFYYEELSQKIKSKILGKSYPTSFKKNYKKISYSDLRYVRVKYIDFDGKTHNDGELIVNKKVASDIVEIFYKLYIAKYPFTKIKLVDEYNADDQLSMQANNTSCFNYRLINNSNLLSNHSLGLAIDINPLLNPHVIDGTYYPKTASLYVDRKQNFVGKIDRSDLSYKLFTSYGWTWGGDFKYSKDYQHFEKKV